MAENEKNVPAEETEDGPDLMTLSDEDGNEVTFEVLDSLDYKGGHYLAVVEVPAEGEQPPQDAQLIFLNVGEDSEGEYLDVVEDDELLLALSKLLSERMGDEFEIES